MISAYISITLLFNNATHDLEEMAKSGGVNDYNSEF